MNLKEMSAVKIVLTQFSVSRNSVNTHHTSFLVGLTALSHGEDAASNRYLSPQASFHFSTTERASRVHDEDTIRCQAVDLSILLPFRRFLLQRTVQHYEHDMHTCIPFQSDM
jgi:hypothetical protein